MTHLFPNTYGPPTIGPQLIGPQLIGPSGQTVPHQFCPHGQMVPQNLVPIDKWSPTNLAPLDKWSLEYSVCPGNRLSGYKNTGTELVGEHLSREIKSVGDHLSRGIDFMGIVCPGGQGVGDRKSGDQMGSGPNASQPLITIRHFTVFNQGYVFKLTSVNLIS